MDEPKVLFSSDLLNKLEEIAFLKIIEATSSEEQARQTKTFIRAFTKRGVSMTTIIDAMLEMYNEQRKESDTL